jgi:hypothetical protein
MKRGTKAMHKEAGCNREIDDWVGWMEKLGDLAKRFEKEWYSRRSSN